MDTINLHLPESLHNQAREIASQEGISLDQFAATAIAEKLSALMTSRYLEQRAARGTRAGFEQAMAKVPDVAPDEQDRL